MAAFCRRPKAATDRIAGKPVKRESQRAGPTGRSSSMRNQPATLAIRELRATPGIRRFVIAIYRDGLGKRRIRIALCPYADICRLLEKGSAVLRVLPFEDGMMLKAIFGRPFSCCNSPGWS